VSLLPKQSITPRGKNQYIGMCCNRSVLISSSRLRMAGIRFVSFHAGKPATSGMQKQRLSQPCFECGQKIGHLRSLRSAELDRRLHLPSSAIKLKSWSYFMPRSNCASTPSTAAPPPSSESFRPLLLLRLPPLLAALSFLSSSRFTLASASSCSSSQTFWARS